MNCKKYDPFQLKFCLTLNNCWGTKLLSVHLKNIKYLKNKRAKMILLTSIFSLFVNKVVCNRQFIKQ